MGFFDDVLDAGEDLGDTLVEEGKKFAADGLEPIFELLGYTDKDVYGWELGSSRVIADADLPSTTELTGALIHAVLNKDDLVPVVIQTMIHGYNTKIKKYLKYGEEEYIYGTPSLAFKSPPIHMDRFEAIVTTLLTTNVYTERSSVYSLKVPTAYDWGLGQLQQDYFYTYFIDIGGNNYTYDGMEESVGVSRAVLKRYSDPETVVYEYIDLPDRINSPYQTYYQYKGRITDSSGNKFTYVHLFAYDTPGPNDGNPEMLDSGSGDFDNTDATRMLPVVVLRSNNVYNTEGTPAYETTDQLMRELTLNLDEFVTALSEDDLGNPNPDMDQVRDAFFICGANPYSESKDTLRYLYIYFRSLYYIMAVPSYQTFINAVNAGNSLDHTIHSIKITEQHYNVLMAFQYIRISYETGSIGDRWDITREFSINEPRTVSIEDGYDENGVKQYITKFYNDSSLTFKRQINDNTYEVMTIHGLQLLTHIIAEDDTVLAKSIVLVDPTDVAHKNFLLPLSYSFMNLHSGTNVENVLLESYNIVLFASDIQHLEWYETEEFALFVAFVFQAIGVYLMVSGGGDIWTIIGQLILAALFQHLLEEMELNDIETAILIGLYIYASGELGAYTSGSGTVSWGLGDTVLKSISALSKAVTIRAEVEMEALEEEAAEFEDLARTYAEQIQDIQDGLEDGEGNLDPMYLKIERPIAYASAEEFINRTLNSDTTQFCVDYPSIFVKSMLDLDTLKIK